MLVAKTERGEIYYYSSVYELPIRRTIENRKYLALKENIGCDYEDAIRQKERVVAYRNSGKEAYAEICQAHLQACEHFITQKADFTNMAFASLIYNVNGRVCNDLSEAGLTFTIQESGLKKAEITALLNQVTNELSEERRLSFPKRYEQFIDPQADYIRAEWRQLQGRTTEDVVNRLWNKFLDSTAPEYFHPGDPNSAFHEIQREFEKTCANMKLAGVQDVHSLTEYQFYTTLELLLSKQDKNQQSEF
jgi:hypothetical protein